jgi:hypothetical protein
MVNPRIGVVATLRSAAARVARSWRYLLLAQAWNFALALCLAVFVQDAIRSSLGSSLAGDRMKASFDPFWYGSFSARAEGVASTFRPSVSGAGAVLDSLETFLDGFASVFRGGLEAELWPVLLVYALSWTFLSGGFLSIFVNPGPAASFFARSARLFPSVLFVSLAGLCGYAAILGPVRAQADAFVAGRLRDVTDERVQFGWTLGEYAALWALLLLLNLELDYTKVFVARLPEGRGALSAALHGFGQAGRLVLGHPLSAISLYSLTGLLGLAGLALYVSVAPGAGHGSTAAILGAFLLGQASVAGRLALRCLFFAGEAHLAAGFVSEPSRPIE